MINVYERQNPYPQILSELYRIAAGRNQRKEELAASQAEAKANRDFQAGQAQLQREYLANESRLGREQALSIYEMGSQRLQAQLDNALKVQVEANKPVLEQIGVMREELANQKALNERQFGTPDTQVVVDDPQSRGFAGPPLIETIPGQRGYYREAQDAEIAANAAIQELNADLRRREMALQERLAGKELKVAREKLYADYDIAMKGIASGNYQARLASDLQRDDLEFRQGVAKDLASPYPKPPTIESIITIPEDVQRGINLMGYNVGQTLTVGEAMKIANDAPSSKVPGASFLQETIPFLGMWARGENEKMAKESVRKLNDLVKLQTATDQVSRYQDELELEKMRRQGLNY